MLSKLSEMTEARTTDQPERNYFRRMDRAMCFMHSRCFQTKSSIVNNTLLGVATPFLMVYMLVYCHARMEMDMWMFGPPRVEDTADEKAPLEQDGGGNKLDEEHEPLARTAVDPRGRRSMAFREKKTGRIITRTRKQSLLPPLRASTNRTRNTNEVPEIIEATATYPPERNWLRRTDRATCFTLFEGVESRALRTILWFTCSPLLMIYIMGYCYPRLRMETWMEGPPPPATNEADEA